MGRIYKRGRIWYIDAYINKKRLIKRFGPSKELAELYLKDLELKVQRNQLDFLDAKEISVKAFYEQFLEYSKTHHKQATQARYRSAITNFIEYLQKEQPRINQLSQITTDIIDKFMIYRRNTPVARNGDNPNKVRKDAVRQGAKSYTVNFEVKTLRTFFNLAIEWKFLQKNPVNKKFRFLKTDDVEKRRVLSQEECERLLAHASKEDYPVFLTFLYTGMRRSELVNLEWTDIDFDNHIIKIQRKSFWTPKTGEREIPISDDLYKVLKNLPRRGNFVFAGKNSSQPDGDTFRLHLVRTAKEAGIKNFKRLHDLRHTYASLLIKNNVDPVSVQKLMGHSNIETTMIYTHIDREHLNKAAQTLKLIPNKSKGASANT